MPHPRFVPTKLLRLAFRTIIITALMSATGCGGGDRTATGDSRAEGPNVILIVIDTLRPDYLSCYHDAAPATERSPERRFLGD